MSSPRRPPSRERSARRRGAWCVAEVYAQTDWLKNNLATLLEAARAAQRVDYIEFARKLIHHARIEEEVMYPAAILVGEYLKLRLAERASID